ncbi:MAG: phasin family protein [Geminocystis sp.]|nr:phasin family protein [Geminocystis sp.]HIK36748.1 phasin family protein [Geminocystis sp. M7585_C2015_104]MCS7146829.1 phasin family protein [Geminocystis sp.]MCX8077022.1 phasin family protein [Geminocystis sp.]MDW8115654.1 phasin family protein [Geminocystis sp.]
MDSNDWLKQLLLIGVGTTSLVAEKLKQVSEQWVKEGRINPDQARQMVDEIWQHIQSDQATLQSQLEKHIKNILQDLGIPKQSEIDELRGRIDRIERKIRDLENKLWR